MNWNFFFLGKLFKQITKRTPSAITHLLTYPREPHRAAVLMSRNTKARKLKRAQLQNEEPCRQVLRGSYHCRDQNFRRIGNFNFGI